MITPQNGNKILTGTFSPIVQGELANAYPVQLAPTPAGNIWGYFPGCALALIKSGTYAGMYTNFDVSGGTQPGQDECKCILVDPAFMKGTDLVDGSSNKYVQGTILTSPLSGTVLAAFPGSHAWKLYVDMIYATAADRSDVTQVLEFLNANVVTQNGRQIALF